MVLWNLQLRFARRLVGIPFQDLKSLIQAAFSVEEAIARGLWTDATASPDSKGKKPIGSFSRSGEVGAISYQHQRLAHHSFYRSPTVKAHFSHPHYQYQPDYVQEPYIAQTSMQPRPPHPRAATHPPPRPHAQRPPRQFTPLGMTLTRAFEKLRDAGMICSFGTTPLVASYSSSFPLTWALLRSSDLGAWYWALCGAQSCDTWLDWFRVGQLVGAKSDHQSPAYAFYTCRSPSS